MGTVTRVSPDIRLTFVCLGDVRELVAVRMVEVQEVSCSDGGALGGNIKLVVEDCILEFRVRSCSDIAYAWLGLGMRSIVEEGMLAFRVIFGFDCVFACPREASCFIGALILALLVICCSTGASFSVG